MVERLTGSEKALIFPEVAVRGLSAPIAKWEACRQAVGVTKGGSSANGPRDSWYRLPGERQTWLWDTGTMNRFLAECLDAGGLLTACCSMWQHGKEADGENVRSDEPARMDLGFRLSDLNSVESHLWVVIILLLSAARRCRRRRSS